MDLYYFAVYLLAYIGIFAAAFYSLNLFSYYRNGKDSLPEGAPKKVTIIIPAYNEEKSIARTIESALSLDYPKNLLELVIVDDGSKDQTYKFARRFESERVRVFHKPNGGKGSALNYGIARARGEIIVTMDADTFVTTPALKKMVRYFADQEVVAVTPAMSVYKPKSIWQRIQHIEYYMGVFLRKSFATMNAIHITPGAFSAYRKDFFKKHGGYDEHNITEDLEIALRIQSHNYVIENEPSAVVYTIAPRSFGELAVQRRRWYVGLVKNLWAYRRLFGFKKGSLGTVVLPVAVTTIVLSIFLTIYVVFNVLDKINRELSYLNAIDFKFGSLFELNSFVFQRFFYTAFSHTVFLISILFLMLLGFYLYFARSKMLYREGLKANFVLFIFIYSLLFAFWWISSAIYLIFNRKVVWRKTKDAD